MKRLYLSIVPLFMLLIPVSAQDTSLQVIASTTLIADVARNVGGELVDVTALIPSDSDVHAFQPAPQDAAMIAEADVVLVNGANLEEGLLALVENSAQVELTVVSDGVEMLGFGADEHEEVDHEHEEVETVGVLGVNTDCGAEDREEHADEEGEHEHGACDPHVWGNPQNVAIWADNIAAALSAADPDNAAAYTANASEYKEQLAALDAELEALYGSIPEAGRVIVSNHEFMGYLAARYELEVVGTVIPSASTLAEPAPQDLADLIATIQETGVKAIFVEVSDAGRLAQVVAQEVGDVTIVALYSDSLSAAAGPAATYIDLMRYDAQAIVEALS